VRKLARRRPAEAGDAKEAIMASENGARPGSRWISRRSFRRLGAALVALVAVALAFAGAGRVPAQLRTASLAVVANDEQGQPLPGVSVKVENVETGLTRLGAVTGAQGSATISALPPGTYKASFDLQGFATVEKTGIVLRVGQTAQVK